MDCLENGDKSSRPEQRPHGSAVKRSTLKWLANLGVSCVYHHEWMLSDPSGTERRFRRDSNDPGYMSRKIGTHATRVNGWEPAVNTS